MPGRDNGFVARHYVPLADLDPRLAQAMLDVLKDESIAAYVIPSTGRLGGYLEVHLPERPRDQLWVDREYHDRAAALLDAHRIADPPPEPAAESLQEPTPADATQIDATAPSTDDEWASIVAGFDLPAFSGAVPWPTAEDLPPDDAPSVPRRVVRPAERGADPDLNRGFVEPVGASEEFDPLSILDEHFVPDPPPPLPRLRNGTRWALLAILLGVGLLVGRSFSDSIPDAVAFGVLAIVGGFVGLVAMMREDRPSDSDPDDGAVV